jgi:RNA polymerase subunit RPABC4/transcription elongation factor Spt4
MKKFLFCHRCAKLTSHFDEVCTQCGHLWHMPS